MEWYTIFTVGVVLIWPAVWSGDRFLIPVVPALFYYLYRGLAALGVAGVDEASAASAARTAFRSGQGVEPPDFALGAGLVPGAADARRSRE